MTQASCKSNQEGFSLIEVLIAVFVVAIGVLGVSSAQLISLKNNQSSYYRSQANFLVMDMLDRMRANPDGVQAGHYKSIDTTKTTPSAALPSCASNTSGCSVKNLAEADAAQWASYFSHANAVGLLPGSTGKVETEIVGTVTNITITVTWSESAWDDDPDGDTATNDGGFTDKSGQVSMTVRL